MTRAICLSPERNMLHLSKQDNKVHFHTASPSAKQGKKRDPSKIVDYIPTLLWLAMSKRKAKCYENTRSKISF
jgi:hypothetical protein